jgi:hypothetical protein
MPWNSPVARGSDFDRRRQAGRPRRRSGRRPAAGRGLVDRPPLGLNPGVHIGAVGDMYAPRRGSTLS